MFRLCDGPDMCCLSVCGALCKHFWHYSVRVMTARGMCVCVCVVYVCVWCVWFVCVCVCVCVWCMCVCGVCGLCVCVCVCVCVSESVYFSMQCTAWRVIYGVNRV